MYINWEINDEAEDISLEEFENDYESFFGFMMLNLGDYQLGYLDKNSPIDAGDEDISYYIDGLIECGITLLLGQDFKIQLLRSNLLEIYVHRYKDVNIKVVNIETQDVQCSFDITFEELLEEIEDNYKKYIATIRVINKELLMSKTVRKSVKYYEILMKMLED
jgi:hypothetical protein